MNPEVLTAWLMFGCSALVILAGVLTVLHQHRDAAASARTRRVAEVERSNGIAAGFAAGWHR